MKKNLILQILIPLQVLLLAFQMISGLLPAVVPYELHRAAGLLFAAGIVWHVLLNWTWIRANFFKR
jgi:hypothetical protein